MTKILAIGAGALGIACVILFLLWDNASARRRLAENALNDALSANASLITDRKRALAEAERNRAISDAALKDAAALNTQVAAIRERLRNGTACRIDPADADALDRLFK